MKKRFIIVLIFFLILIISGIVFYFINRQSKIKITDDYFAVINYSPSAEFGGKMYLYIEQFEIKIIRTSWHTETWGSPSIEEDVLEKKKMKYNEYEKNIYKLITENYGENYYIILNKDVSEFLNEKSYSKGDEISLDELISLIKYNQIK